MGLLAIAVFGLPVRDPERRLVTIVETDGCAADGISAATGCTVGNRRLRIVDYGKVAATCVDMRCQRAVRIVPKPGIRKEACARVPDAESRWHAQLLAYQSMSDFDLLDVQEVELCIPLKKVLSKYGGRVSCQVCGEEIINERQVVVEGKVLCRACAGQQYYRAKDRPHFVKSRRNHHAFVDEDARVLRFEPPLG